MYCIYSAVFSFYVLKSSLFEINSNPQTAKFNVSGLFSMQFAKYIILPLWDNKTLKLTSVFCFQMHLEDHHRSSFGAWTSVNLRWDTNEFNQVNKNLQLKAEG